MTELDIIIETLTALSDFQNNYTDSLVARLLEITTNA